MVNETYSLEAGKAKCTSKVEEGIVFVRWLAPGCWALTADHHVYYIRRRKSLGAHSREARTFDCHDPWSPDKGIA
jgi:hypothetical protein